VTIRAVYSTGYTGSEASVVMHGRQLPGGTPVIFCHGVLVGAQQTFNAEGQVQRELADLYEVTSGGADLGGLSTWGNDASIAAVSALITYMGSTYGTKTARVVLYGTSMGALTALNWAMANPTKVAAVGLTAPAVSLQGIHDRDPIGLAALIDTAYTNHAGYVAALPVHDPSHANNRDVIRSLGNRMRVWYSTDDNVIAASEVLAFAGYSGCVLDSMGAIGHAASASALSAVAQWLDGFCS
jgi:pimeloyl-ACP methyl ester carboxylesterase